MNKLIWLIKQLLPLRYDSTFTECGVRQLCTWRMWLGWCFDIRYYTLSQPPAYVPAPGSILKGELEARGWTQKQFAKMLNRPEQVISLICTGKKAITAKTAVQLAKQLGTSAHLWLTLEGNYQIWKVEQGSM